MSVNESDVNKMSVNESDVNISMDTTAMPHHLITTHTSIMFTTHAVPGTIFMLLGLRWMYCSMYRYYLCQREKEAKENAREYESSLLYPSSVCPKIPLVNYLVLIGAASGLILQTLHHNSHLFVVHNLMHLGFFLGALVDLLGKYRLPVPKHSEYVVALVASFSNALLLFTHAKEKSVYTDYLLHERLILLMFISVVVLPLEVCSIHWVIPALFRGIITFSLGAWYVTIGSNTLHDPDLLFPNTKMGPMKVEVVFVLELFTSVIFTFFVGLLAFCAVKRLNLKQVSNILDREYSWINDSQFKSRNKIKNLCSSQEPLLSDRIDF